MTVPYETKMACASQRGTVVNVDDRRPSAVGIHREISEEGFLNQISCNARRLTAGQRSRFSERHVTDSRERSDRRVDDRAG